MEQRKHIIYKREKGFLVRWKVVLRNSFFVFVSYKNKKRMRAIKSGKLKEMGFRESCEMRWGMS